ncbi:expressed unknown protein [Seminavis robusta]|uniref:Uncharacterized protein n=1 Tax=Seminavis robusta TaxID=568900 RepID=A0A9N8ELX3_9STRA|nr:expressed unknown protein [Seminavis robusta]|eukprot:Sro1148_g246480.1 n/a (495) ;mRNA; r:10700-12184
MAKSSKRRGSNKTNEHNKRKQQRHAHQRLQALLRRSQASSAGNELISLIYENPSLACRSVDGVTPLKVLLESGVKLDVIQEFCKRFPRSVETPSHVDIMEELPLETACYQHYKTARGVIPFLVVQLKVNDLEGNSVWGERLLTALNRILVFCNAATHTAKRLEDIEALLQAVSRTGILASQREAQGRLLTWAFQCSDCTYGDLLDLVLPYCANVTHISISYENYTTVRRQQDLSASLAKLVPQLTHLDLHVCWQVRDQHAWRHFLVQALAQDAKHLQSLQLKFWKEPNNDNALPEPLPGWIFKALVDCFVSSSAFPNLQELVLETRPGILAKDHGVAEDLTMSLATLLGKNNLRQLTVIHFCPRYQPLFDALQTNSSLQRFEVPFCTNAKPKLQALYDTIIRHNNTTLLHVNGLPEDHLSELIRHRCNLNRKGLGRAQNPDTPITTLLDIVADAMDDNWGYRISGDTSAGFAFAMLRGCPSIWCGVKRPKVLQK